MKHSIKNSDGVGFARKESYEYDGQKYDADLKDGDIITITAGGVQEMGTFGEQINFKINTRNGEKKIGFNQTTKNVLIKEFGEDDVDWVGKKVTVILKKDIIAGKKAIVPYFVTDGWKLDEYGELVKDAFSDGVPMDEEVINFD